MFEEHFNPEGSDRKQQDRSERDAHNALDTRPVADPFEEGDPEKSGGNGARGEPRHEPPLDGSPSCMHRRANRLHDQRRDEVAGNSRDGLHVKQEHEHRGHQSAAPHTGETDSAADDHARQRYVEIDMHPD